MTNRVAVIAVHGVGSPEPASTAQAVAEMLVRFGDGSSGMGRYTACREVGLEIPVSPARIASKAPPGQPTSLPAMQRLGAWLNDRSDYVRKQRDEQPIRTPEAPPAVMRASTDSAPLMEAAGAPEHQFMLGQLLDYKPTGTPYHTTRYELTRSAAEGQTEVHVYEAHWADLSRLGKGASRVFGAVHQLLIHLSNLGRKEVDYAFIEFGSRNRHDVWWWFSTINGYAVRTFGFIPVINLVMLVVLSSVIPTKIPSPMLMLIALALAAVFAAAAVGVAAFRRGTPATPTTPGTIGRGTEWRPFGWACLVIAAVWVVVFLATVNRWFSPGFVLVAEWWLVAAAGSDALLRLYDAQRPGALVVGRIALGLAAALFIAGLLIAFRTPTILSITEADGFDHGAVWHAALWTFAAFGGIALALWLLFFAFAIVASISSLPAWLAAAPAGTPKDEAEARRERAYKATATSRLTLAMSALLYFVATMLAIGLLGSVAARMAPRLTHPSLAAALGHTWPRLQVPDSQRLDVALSHIVESWVPTGAVSALLLGFGGFTLMSWVVVLIGYTETHTFRRDSLYDNRMGVWLSAGFSVWDVIVTTITEIAILLWLPGSVAWRLWQTLGHGLPYTYTPATTDWQYLALAYLDAAVAAAGVGLLTLRAQLSHVADSLRTPLGIVLDVDNYLRESPTTATPRAQIAERFVSLLRYVYHDGYDAIVFVAHSQGTIVATDTLRFVRTEGDPALVGLGLPRGSSFKSRTPLRLLTFGSPLRQLYGARFPHLYSWVIGRPPGKPWTSAECELTGAEQCAAPDLLPDPAALGVEQWVNVYMSGDYIGRYLWPALRQGSPFFRYTAAQPGDRRGTPINPPLSVFQDPSGARREMCLGAGAHTHYWIHPDVASELDLLIAP